MPGRLPRRPGTAYVDCRNFCKQFCVYAGGRASYPARTRRPRQRGPVRDLPYAGQPAAPAHPQPPGAAPRGELHQPGPGPRREHRHDELPPAQAGRAGLRGGDTREVGRAGAVVAGPAVPHPGARPREDGSGRIVGGHGANAGQGRARHRPVLPGPRPVRGSRGLGPVQPRRLLHDQTGTPRVLQGVHRPAVEIRAHRPGRPSGRQAGRTALLRRARRHCPGRERPGVTVPLGGCSSPRAGRPATRNCRWRDEEPRPRSG
jgi:hypothetical protein